VTDIPAILAAEGNDIGELVRLIPFVVIALLFWIGNLLKRKIEEARQQERKQEAATRRRSDDVGQPPRKADARPANVREALQRAAMRSMGVEVEAEPEAPPAPPPMPSELPRHPRRAAERAPNRPSPTPPTPAAPTPQPLRRALAPAAPMAPKIRVDLKNREALRRAILYHEIFSPPKALRDPDEF